jgi:hypothetical protein
MMLMVGGVWHERGRPSETVRAGALQGAPVEAGDPR